MLGRQRGDQIAMRRLCRTSACDQAAVGTLRECCNPPLNLGGIPHVDGAQLQAKRGRKRLDCAEQAGASGDAGLPKNRYSSHLRRDLLEQLQPFPTDGIFVNGKTGGVAPGRAKLST